MIISTPFCIRFSGITIRIKPCAPVSLSQEFLDLLCEECATPDAEYEIIPLHTPLTPTASLINNGGIMIYPTQEGWLRIYPTFANEDGCQVACLLRSDEKNIIYYPASLWNHFTSPLKCAPHMALESVLIRHHAMLLHSSVVEVNGQAVLFCGPSGVGKSTQASLWEKYENAQILNGDRCVIMDREDRFYGGGSPLAGSSHIYRSEQYPIAGIFLLEQSPENSISRVFASALPSLLSQTLINSWDTDFMTNITNLYQKLLMQVPIYHFRCRPDQDAVKIAYKTLFEKES